MSDETERLIEALCGAVEAHVRSGNVRVADEHRASYHNLVAHINSKDLMIESWKEDARRYADNVSYWREQSEAKDARIAELVAALAETSATLEVYVEGERAVVMDMARVTERIAELEAEVERLCAANDIYIRRISGALGLLPPPDIEIDGKVMRYTGPTGTLQQIRLALLEEWQIDAAMKPTGTPEP